MGRISKPPEERKRELINAAEELFIEQGYEHTSVSEIVKKVGVAQGTFYYYFKSKEEILNAILERKVEAFANIIEKEILEDDKLNAQQKWQFVMENTAIYLKVKGELAKSLYREENAIIRRKNFKQKLDRLIPLYGKIIEQGVKEGMFDTEFPEETIELLTAMMDYVKSTVNFGENMQASLRKIKTAEIIYNRALGAKERIIQFIPDELT